VRAESNLRFGQAIPCQPGLCTQPSERLIRNVVETRVEERILFPGFLAAGFQVGNDSSEDRAQVHSMAAVAQSIENVLMLSRASDRRGLVEGPVDNSVPG
jgi:hypothetical protein